MRGFFRRFRKISNAIANSVMSVRPFAWNNLAPTERSIIKFDIRVFIQKYIEKIQVSLKSNKNNRFIMCRPLYNYDVLLDSTWNEKCFRKRL